MSEQNEAQTQGEIELQTIRSWEAVQKQAAKEGLIIEALWGEFGLKDGISKKEMVSFKSLTEATHWLRAYAWGARNARQDADKERRELTRFRTKKLFEMLGVKHLPELAQKLRLQVTHVACSVEKRDYVECLLRDLQHCGREAERVAKNDNPAFRRIDRKRLYLPDFRFLFHPSFHKILKQQL